MPAQTRVRVRVRPPRVLAARRPRRAQAGRSPCSHSRFSAASADARTTRMADEEVPDALV